MWNLALKLKPRSVLYPEIFVHSVAASMSANRPLSRNRVRACFNPRLSERVTDTNFLWSAIVAPEVPGGIALLYQSALMCGYIYKEGIWWQANTGDLDSGDIRHNWGMWLKSTIKQLLHLVQE